MGKAVNRQWVNKAAPMPSPPKFSPVLWFSLWGLLLWLLPACGSAVTVTPPPPVFLTIAGSTSMEPLLLDLSDAYHQQQPHITFDIQRGGSQLGQALTENGQVDIGLVAWSPQTVSEQMRQVPVARDAIAIILHPDNPLPGLSLVELQDIFSGRLLNWQAVDGPSLPIQVVSRETGSGTRTTFESSVMGNQSVTPTAIVLPNSQAVVDFVAQTPNAVGYVAFNFADNKAVYVVPLEGEQPTLESLAANSYPLTRDLSLIVPKQETNQKNAPEIEKFVEFVLSPVGQAVVGEKWGRVR